MTARSNRLLITSSPMAKPVEAPAPQVTMAMRTRGSGASSSTSLWRNFGLMRAKWLTVFHYTIYTTCIVGLVLTVLSLLYFNARARPSVSWSRV